MSGISHAWYTRNDMGRQMVKAMEDHLERAGFVMKYAELDDSPHGFNFYGVKLQKFQNQYGAGVQMTVPAMVESCQTQLRLLGVESVQEAWLPCSKDWDPFVAAQAREAGTGGRADQDAYLLNAVTIAAIC